MKNKTQRLLKIKNIIANEKIANQEELLHKLEESGLSYTQATLSRDLKFLKVSRVVDENKEYVYKLPSDKGSEEEKAGANEEFIFMGFKELKFSNNLGVIKTQPGYAPGIASVIDNMNLFEIIGTIAGDDTILIIPSDGVTKQDIINILSVSIPALKEHLK